MKQETTQSPPPDIVRLVVEDAAKDLREARAALTAAQEARGAKEREVNEAFKPAVDASQDAGVALRAHERYKDHMPRQAWDEEHRRLERAQRDAEAHQEAERERLLGSLRPVADEESRAARRVQELEAEWRVHERTARIAGINTESLLREEA